MTLSPRSQSKTSSKKSTKNAKNSKPLLGRIKNSTNKQTDRNQLTITNAYEHNLKNVSVDIPRNKFVVMTGVSGSGKSSLAFDTIFKEGQRRYIASLSSYARQFIQNIDRPNVDLVDGLSPTICIDQKSVGRNPRSTVGTITEVYDFLRLLFARLGNPHCPNGHGPISSQSVDSLLRQLYQNYENKTLMVMAPLILDRKGEYRKEIQELSEAGFIRVLIDGKLYRTDQDINLERYEKHTIEVVIDRVEVNQENHSRIGDAIQKSVALSEGKASFLDYQKLDRGEEKRVVYSSPDYLLTNLLNACAICGESIKEMEPKLFSFNSPQDACRDCHGIGHLVSFDPWKFVKDPDATVFEGALSILNPEGNVLYTRRGQKQITELFKRYKLKIDLPWKQLPRNFQKRILGVDYDQKKPRHLNFNCLEVVERLNEKYNISSLKKYQAHTPCQACGTSGLNKTALHVLFDQKNIFHFNQMQIKELFSYFEKVDFSSYNEKIWKPILKEIKERLFFLNNVGLDYLTLNRKANTLSGGEAQRIRLASQVGSGLEGCLYILDEPSIGLHSRDNEKLINTLKLLKAKNNSLIVIEHDEDTMLAADYLVELGPKAGIHGGEITYANSPARLKDFLLAKNQKKLKQNETISYLLGAKNILIPTRRVVDFSKKITLKNVKEFNLKNITIDFPLESFIVLTGVSGSGKSTLLTVLSERISQSLELQKVLRRKKSNKSTISGETPVNGIEALEKIIEINQKPIGRTPRSNPATYTKIWEVIRDMFAQSKEAKIRGFKKGRFSFNVKGGRCEECGGAGIIKVETQIFSPIEVTCETCNGKRFNPATLNILYREKSIYDILEMNFEDAEEFFESIPKLKRVFNLINQIGLGYLKLGQPSTTLSGGEAQRIKIASELGKPSQGKTLYLLDEPTTGLHFDDINKLLHSLQRLVDQKNTVIVIEHNLEVIKSCDHIIELGPKGGDEGGMLVYQGSYEKIVEHQPLTVTAESIKIYNQRQQQRESGYFLNSKNFQDLFPETESKLIPVEPTSKTSKTSLVPENQIEIVGLKKHNLKNISLNIPKGQITVFTGVSGSGKSSIALDSVFIEGQRKYLESLSTYARRFLGRVQRPDAEKMENLSPSIAIDQKKSSNNPRSTISTQTEIYDSLRVLYANIGHPHCEVCDRPLQRYSETLGARELISQLSGKNCLILAPLYIHDFQHNYLLKKMTDFKDYVTGFQDRGYYRFLIDDELIKSDDPKILKQANKADNLYLVIDRIHIEKENEDRITEALEKAYEIGHGVAGIQNFSSGSALSTNPTKPTNSGNPAFFLTKFYSCPVYQHNVVIKENLTPRHFSFNHHLGACELCEGIGSVTSLNFYKLLPAGKPLITHLQEQSKTSLKGFLSDNHLKRLQEITASFKRDFLEEQSTLALSDLKVTERKFLLYGFLDQELLTKPQYDEHWISACSNNTISDTSTHQNEWPGLFYLITGKSTRIKKDLLTLLHQKVPKLRQYLEETECFLCNGGRLQPLYSQVKIAKTSLPALLTLRIPNFHNFITDLPNYISSSEQKISADTLNELQFRTSQLLKLGLNYLTFNRRIDTLSGGEMQRIRLSTQIGNQLRDVIYVLDEPTIGLHERDNQRLIDVINSLKNQGNTVLLVEHDASIIKAGDHIVDVGPEAGERGGRIVYAGANKKPQLKDTSFYHYIYQLDHFKYPRNFLQSFDSRKDDYLNFKRIYHHNLVNQTVQLPLQRLVAISGVSGSGKSSLLEWINQQLLNLIEHGFITKHKITRYPAIDLQMESGPKKRQLTDLQINKVYLVEQTPVSLNKRSVIVSYMDIFDTIRDVFAKTKGSKVRGYGKGNFSFNSHAGGCQQCRGLGEEEIEMHFISDVTVICESCHGHRYQKEVLEVYYQGKNIYEVLELTFEEALEFFYSFKKIRTKIKQLIDAGLGYLKLGFKTSLLSGGELQRLKIAHELAFENPQNSFYLLDEPTTGLHFKDIEKMVVLLEKLVEQGGTVVVIEHNLEFLRSVDHIIELGPEGGDQGGRVINSGSPEKIKQDKIGFTSNYL